MKIGLLPLVVALGAQSVSAHPEHDAHDQAERPLSDEEQRILSRGEITAREEQRGQVLGTLLGFGIGQAAQGRYSESGYIFTLGELGSFAVMAYGAFTCLDDYNLYGYNDGVEHCNTAALITGALSFVAFRIWELSDLWRGPSIHNKKYRRLRARQPVRLSPYVVPASRGDGAVGGLTLRF